MANGKCYHHGGSSLSGIAHPNFQGKGYARDLPVNLAEAYERIRSDPELKSLNNELALLELRIHDLVKRLTTGATGTLWDDLQSLIIDAEQPGATLQDILPALTAVVTKGRETEAAWRDLDAAIHSKAKVSAMERRAETDAAGVMTRVQAAAMLAAIVGAVKSHVTDPVALAGISQDLRQLITVR